MISIAGAHFTFGLREQPELGNPAHTRETKTNARIQY